MSYIPHSRDTIKQMLDSIGIGSIEELYRDIPQELFTSSFNIGPGMSEYEVIAQFDAIAGRNNRNLVQFSGGGFYDHFIPSAVDYLASRGEFFTAYTPYQPEASQGTLQALYEYQTAICELTGMDASNASLYDGGTAIVEAILMALRASRRRKVYIDEGVNPLYRRIVQSSFCYLDYEIIEVSRTGTTADVQSMESLIDDDTAAVVVENPDFFGEVHDYTQLADLAHSRKALLILSVYPISLGILKTPADMGADIVTAEGQSLGNHLNFGGPYLGILAAREKLIRTMPGRIAGRTVDSYGRDAYVLTLQAREQHIRRQKATSNICSNQNLCALRALIFLSLLGPDGLADLARTNHSKACYMKQILEKIPGVSVENKMFFNTITLSLPKDAREIYASMLEHDISFGIPLAPLYMDNRSMESRLLLTVTEKRTDDEMNKAASCLREVL